MCIKKLNLFNLFNSLTQGIVFNHRESLYPGTLQSSETLNMMHVLISQGVQPPL